MNDSYHIGTFPATIETWGMIQSLQKSLKNTPKRLTLYGRVSNRRKLAEKLHKSDDSFCYSVSGDKLELATVHLALRGRVPLRHCERVAVYVKDRPKTKWVQKPDSDVWEIRPTKWAS